MSPDETRLFSQWLVSRARLEAKRTSFDSGGQRRIVFLIRFLIAHATPLEKKPCDVGLIKKNMKEFDIKNGISAYASSLYARPLLLTKGKTLLSGYNFLFSTLTNLNS